MTGDWKDLGENRKNTSYNLQIYIEIMDSQKVKFVNCKLMTWERIVSYTLHFTIYKFVNIMDSLMEIEASVASKFLRAGALAVFGQRKQIEISK